MRLNHYDTRDSYWSHWFLIPCQGTKSTKNLSLWLYSQARDPMSHKSRWKMNQDMSELAKLNQRL